MKLLLVDGSTIFRMGLRALFTAPGAADVSVVGECADGAEGCALAASLVPDVVRHGAASARPERHRIDARAGAHGAVRPRAGPGRSCARGHRPPGPGRRSRRLRPQGAITGGGAGRRSGCRARRAGPSARRLRAAAAAGRPQSTATAWSFTRSSGCPSASARSSIWSSGARRTSRSRDGLGISIKTVETHRGHINGKLRVHTSADIVRLASLWGMITTPPAADGVAARALPQ